ncbi:hypothetical protein [Candidatus Hodarchaeum mangrovi]
MIREKVIIKRDKIVSCTTYTAQYKERIFLEEKTIPRTSAITIRLDLETIHEVEKFAEILRLKPSTLLGMVIKGKLKEFAEEYVDRVYKEVKEL